MLAAGAALFLGARLWLILSAALVMGMPRLGDDGFTYLWKGVQSGAGYATDRPALQDVLALRDLPDSPGEELNWQRSRVTMRAVGTLAPLGDAIYGTARLLQLNAKWTFAAVEVAVAVLLALGLARFLNVFFGAAAAGIGLGILAFTVFPNQGLSYLIPSTLALGLALLAWAEIASTSPRWWLAAIVCVALPFIHPIGKAYLALVFAWPFALALVQRRFPGRRQLLAVGAVSMIPLALSLALPMVIPSLAPPSSGNLGGLSADGVMQQLPPLGDQIRELVRKSPLLVMLPIAAFLAAPVEADRRLVALAALLLGALLASLLHHLPGYPAELASRVLVLAAILAAGIAGKSAIVLWRSRRVLQLGTGVLLAAWIASAGASWVGRHALQMQRPQIFDEQKLATRIGEVPAGAAIVYFEADIALFASLPLGADRRHAVILPMLKGSPDLARHLQRHSDRIGVVPVHPSLNVLAKKVRGATAHRFGFPGHAISAFALGELQGLPGAVLWLYVVNDGSDAVIQVQLREERGGEPRPLAVAAGHRGWLRVAALPSGNPGVTVHLPDDKVWVSGISFAEPVPGIFWPWGSGAEVRYEYRKLKRPKGGRLGFSVDELLSEYGAREFAALVDRVRPVLSDDSGLVFLRLGPSPG
jgi:hypothetical protein